MVLNIQLLRFVAALLVVFYHAKLPLAGQQLHPGMSFLQGFAQFGFAGVDLFFVISGAIMAESTRKLTPGLNASWYFISRRYARVYSGWWPVMFIILVAHMLFGFFPYEGKDLQVSFFLIPVPLNEYIFPVIWTLPYELYFYMITGVLIFFSRQIQLRALFILMLIIGTATIALSQQHFYSPHRPLGYPYWFEFMLSPFVLEFLGGFMVCEYVRRKPQQPWRLWLSVAACFIVVGVCYQLYGNLHAPGLDGLYGYPERVMMFGIPCCCFVAVALTLPDPTRPFLRRLSYLGDASYSLYLTHMLVMPAWNKVMKNLPIITDVLGPHVPILIGILAAIVYSLIHYRYIERPLYRLFLRMLGAVNGFFAKLTRRTAQ